MRHLSNKKLFGAAAVAFLLVLQGCSSQTLRVAPHTELKVFDPIWTTAYITRDHGYLVYDTLFSMNEMYEPEPQMVDTWSVSADKTLWTFQLREGLKWHDGKDVTAEDCIASLQRWGKRDGLGQLLFRDIESLSANDAVTFEMKLKRPNAAVLQMLAKLSSNVPFMMPKRLAQSDPFTAIQDPIGSGPFIFSKDEWVPGSKVVYVKNKKYIPRKEPVSLAAGGKVAKLDRIIWKFYPDQTSATQALIDGEVDYMESPSTKMIPLLEGKKEITLAFTDPSGNVAMSRFNTLLPPFDDVAVRRAAIMAMDQSDYMTAALGDPKYWRTCYSVFPCGTQFESEVGNELMKIGNIEAAKKALQATSYDGTPVVILNPVDSPVISAMTQVTVNKLREIGMVVEVRDMTWASLTEQRANRESVANGGWNMFHTWWIAADLSNPMAIAFSGNRNSGWFGWPEDAQLEELRSAFIEAGSEEQAQEIAGKIQARLFDIAAFAVLGQFFEPVAYSNKVYGVTSPIHFFGNMSFEKPE
ncbi:MAG: ABC transporter substrate-binding protein [Cycloclasticus sp.]|jgi:peptide/nickel transport system substrate-binding protein|nr:ABC transporter substrate-binding protein [Cycloclasticus sp.]